MRPLLIAALSRPIFDLCAANRLKFDSIRSWLAQKFGVDTLMRQIV